MCVYIYVCVCVIYMGSTVLHGYFWDCNLYDPMTAAHGLFDPWAIRDVISSAGRWPHQIWQRVGATGQGRPGLWSIGPLVQDRRIPSILYSGTKTIDDI